ncbi:recombination mediator RecR [Patescibacteria group bacterium]
MNILPPSIENLITELSSLPGIGPRSAERLAFYLLKQGQEELRKFGDAFRDLKDGIATCSSCHNFTENDPCPICSDRNRDKRKLCVVSEPLDVVALEKTHEFDGIYHVLQGAISPIDGIGPEELTVNELVKRVKNGDIREIILATSPTTEGEATSLYISKLLRPTGVKITRIARGLPIGGDLEYADEATLSRALEGRKEYI